MKRVLYALLGLALLLVAVILLRTFTSSSLQPEAHEVEPAAFDEEEAIQRLARSISYRTVTGEGGVQDAQPFLDLHRFLRVSFPRVHDELELELVNELSLLYTWEGLDAGLEPIVLMGHLDVVPVSLGTESDWEQPPFGGVVAGGFVWGRGAVDDKASVMAILEGTEMLLRDGYRPRRTVYLAFGHDEEVGGSEGRQRIAELLASRGVERFALVLDEGGVITEGIVPGIQGPVAIIGIAEKGSVTLTLRVEGPGGHSSTPPERTNIGILARAITRLEDDPFPARLSGVAREMLAFLAPEMGFLERMALSNLWLFEPLVTEMTGKSLEGLAMLHTTSAATMIDGGFKSNVLPTEASAEVNFRILPGETPETVAERVRTVIDDDRVQVLGEEGGRPPSPISDPRSAAFTLIGRTAKEVAGSDLLVAPYLVIAGTDSRYFAKRSDNVFRFIPVLFEEGGMKRVHGTNERLSVASYPVSVRFFYRLIRGSDELP